EPDRGIPVAVRPLAQRAQEEGGVVGVDGGVERIVERAEGVRVHLQIHLHTADIHELHPVRQALLGPGDRFRLGGEEIALPVGVDRPGPGFELAGRVATAAFHLGDGDEQPGRGLVLAFGVLDRVGAERGLARARLGVGGYGEEKEEEAGGEDARCRAKTPHPGPLPQGEREKNALSPCGRGLGEGMARTRERRARAASRVSASSAGSWPGCAISERSTRRRPMAPRASSATSAAGGRSRSAGSQIARRAAKRSPCSSATRATAPLSRSTATAPVISNQCRFSAALATAVSPHSSVPPSARPRSVGSVGRSEPASSTCDGTTTSPGRSAGSSPPARPNLTSAVAPPGAACRAGWPVAI